MRSAGLWAALGTTALALGAHAQSEPPSDTDQRQPDEVPTARPVLAVDDTRTHGPTARNWFDLAVVPALMLAPRELAADGQRASGTVFATTAQLSVGLPTLDVREVRELFDRYALSRYQLRVRDTAFHARDRWLAGPLTVAFQRYFPIDPLAISPLVYAHAGLDVAIATPWLSGRFEAPPTAVGVLNGVDTELARNGWSLRPVTPYVRGDFLACRSWYGELGGGPEVFVPSRGATEYDARFRAAVGASLGCNGNMSPHAPKVSLEYRGRVRLYAADAAPAYRDSIGAAVQLDLGPFVAQAFYSADLGRRMSDFATFGVRLQIGAEK
jgi:hypothetical protein